jgi:hypothetical protein
VNTNTQVCHREAAMLKEPETSRQFSLHVRSGQIRERTGKRSEVNKRA